MNIKLIAAIGNNGEIGQNNKLIYPIKEDLKRFKRLTDNSVVVMGMNTFTGDLKCQPLSNRINIVMSKTHNQSEYDHLVFADSTGKVMQLSYRINKPIWVIGGGQIYNLFMPLVSELYITHIHKDFPDADKHLHIDYRMWQVMNLDKRDGFTWIDYART